MEKKPQQRYEHLSSAAETIVLMSIMGDGGSGNETANSLGQSQGGSRENVISSGGNGEEKGNDIF